MARVLMLLAAAAVSTSWPVESGTAGESQIVTTVRRYTPADRTSGRYQYVPFQVPAGVAALRIGLDYNRAEGENVVDLGLFEPGPLDLGTAAFRGYSGGSKRDVRIGVTDATPGYRAGPLPAGTWHVLLGLYRVRDAGVEVSIRIETEVAASPSVDARAASPLTTSSGAFTLPSAPAGSTPARRSEPEWYMGALHLHTEHSDGTVEVAELLRQTREAGFDFIAITDHNNTTHTRELPGTSAGGAGPLVISGEEVTTPAGHASVWGLPPGGWVDFRVDAGNPQIGTVVAAARRQGALFSINHPVSTCVGCAWDHAVVDGIEAIEVSNGRHGEVADAVERWDALLVAGRRLTAVGSSDWHVAPNPIDVANVRVQATALTQEALLTAIRAGRVIIVNGARHATPQISARVVAPGAAAAGKVLATAGIGHTLAITEGTMVTLDVRAASLPYGRLHIIANGSTPQMVPLDDRGAARLDWPAQHGYVRFELYAADKTAVAYTNPIFVNRPQ